ncbi:hypothetical protein BO71DRAFT_174525 [Aspergillus ellipticus CBS 707.79]|uniref:Zn(2)-C6 fungal-type domain-containing protein n=1 Tax=Aspergillus ellipticus CBS 707.79 TaxID=1448320 RepID=A0A319DGH4_9EURO|nr:hypothetical protein BO71DRAFT_174525 [Aspergillus ellipticus CBS 707.79]
MADLPLDLASSSDSTGRGPARGPFFSPRSRPGFSAPHPLYSTHPRGEHSSSKPRYYHAMRQGQSSRRLRVTTGCLTCRTRRVKCDEKRPTCRNCARRNRPCSYDTNRHTHIRPANHQNDDSGHGANLAGRTFSTSNQVNHNALSNMPREEQELSPLPTPPPAAVHPIANLCTILQSANGPDDEAIGSYSALERTHQAILPPFAGDRRFAPTSFRLTNSIQLLDAELPLFRNYVDKISKWVDSFSHDQPFYLQVPAMALQCPMLLHSCLAVSAKQMSRVTPANSSSELQKYSVFYYQQALREMGHFLIEPHYSDSDEYLASSIILSTYEIIDVAGESFGSHLKGIASLIRSHGIHGDESGIRGATYWTWYRHEVWAAFQTGRRMFLDENYWQPSQPDNFAHSSIREVANLVLFIFGQCITYHVTRSRGHTYSDESIHTQQALATKLELALEAWKERLPPSMMPFSSKPQLSPISDGLSREYSDMLSFVWFAYPESAVSHQLYHASKILLALHSKCISERDPRPCDPFQLRRQLESSRTEILTIANSGINEAWGLISTQCLYIAGLITDGILERQRTIQLIEACQETSGRHTTCISDQLRNFWSGV